MENDNKDLKLKNKNKKITNIEGGENSNSRSLKKKSMIVFNKVTFIIVKQTFNIY